MCKSPGSPAVCRYDRGPQAREQRGAAADPGLAADADRGIQGDQRRRLQWVSSRGGVRR